MDIVHNGKSTRLSDQSCVFAIFSFTGRGKALADRTADLIPSLFGAERVLRYHGADVKDGVRTAFSSCRALLFVGASGIAVRMTAPYLRDKYTDPAVLVMDEAGQFVIPLLSGHVGNANRYAEAIAERTGAVPVITTATDVNGRFAVDLWASEQDMAIGSREAAKAVSMALLNGDTVPLVSEFPIEGPVPEGIRVEDGLWENGNTPVSIRVGIKERITSAGTEGQFLQLTPRCLCLGAGCRKDADPEAVWKACRSFLARLGILPEAVGVTASIDLKAEEPALLELSEKLHARFVTFSAEEPEKAPGSFPESGFVRSVTGVGNVCQRSAALVYPEILAEKTAVDGVTFALSIRKPRLTFPSFTEHLSREEAVLPALIIGGAHQGKLDFAELLAEKDPGAEILFPAEQVRSVRASGESAEAYAARLLKEHPKAVLVIPTVGNGVVPMDPEDRADREYTGRLQKAAAALVPRVYEVVCGIPRRIRHSSAGSFGSP